MSELKIIVEGGTDKKFITDYVLHAFGRTLHENEFIIARGNLLSQPANANTIQINSTAGGENILIFDADNDLEETKLRVNSEIEQFNLEIHSQFFFPNNEQAGNLETLLRHIINPDRLSIIECIENYGECVKAHDIPELKAFDDKRMFYIYFDTFLIKNERGKKEEARDYTEPLLWDLDSEYLTPLYDFLQPYFSE